MSNLRRRWDRRRDLRRNAATLGCYVTIRTEDDRDNDPLVSPIGYDSLMRLPWSLRRRALRELRYYYLSSPAISRSYPWNNEPKPAGPARLVITTKNPEKYMLLDTEAGVAWKWNGRSGWKRAKEVPDV